METPTDKWEKLREPFNDNEIELLPRYTGPKDDNGKPKNPKKACDICNGYHASPSIHLKYIGHAGITMRLNEVDPNWSWEPLALDSAGLPRLTEMPVGKSYVTYGLWIRMTVLGKTLVAFGDMGGKTGISGNAMKEIIGDAIRNGAMRFGVGTYLWSKSEKALAEAERNQVDEEEETPPKAEPLITDAQMRALRAAQKKANVSDEILHHGIERDFGITSTKLLTKSQASEIIDRLKKIEGTPNE